MIKISKLIGGACFISLAGGQLSATPTNKTEKTAPATQVAKPTHNLNTAEKRISSALGQAVGGQIKNTVDNIDLEAFISAIKRELKGETPVLSQEETMAAMQEFQTKAQKKMEAKAEENKKILAEKAKETKKVSEKFLTENKSKAGVKTTKSGLQYKIVKAGTGEVPKADSQVLVHYEGKLIDGTVFDSSYKRGEPVTFGVNQVIPGWTEALTMMPVGSEWEVYIPSDLAYADKDLPGIPANSVLVFKVELKEIKKPETALKTEATPKKDPAKG